VSAPARTLYPAQPQVIQLAGHRPCPANSCAVGKHIPLVKRVRLNPQAATIFCKKIKMQGI